MALLSVEDALARVLDGVEATEAEPLPSSARTAACSPQPLQALLTQPPFTASAMDGYAVRAADIAALPATLDRDRHGRRRPSFRRQRRGRRGGAHLHRRAGARRRRRHRHPGERRARRRTGGGARGRRWSPSTSAREAWTSARATRCWRPVGGWAARALAWRPPWGTARSPCAGARGSPSSRPATSWCAPGARPGPGQIVASNHLGVAALAQAAGAEARLSSASPATRARTSPGISPRRAGADILVTIGGASVGEHDLVAPVLKARGMALAFWKIAMRPGKPLMFGRLGDARVLGLPGNPASAFVVRAAVPRAADLAPARPAGGGRACAPSRRAWRAPLEANGPRQHYMRAVSKRWADGLLRGRRRSLPAQLPDRASGAGRLSPGPPAPRACRSLRRSPCPILPLDI